MAAPQANPKAQNNPATQQAAQENVVKHTKEYDETRTVLFDKLAQQEQHKFSATPNLVDKVYTIHTDNPLPHLDTALAKAYRVSDKRDSNKLLYALVSHGKMPPRGNITKALMGASAPHIVTMHAASLVEISGLPGRRYVIIYDQPKGKSLSSIMQERGSPLPESFIIEHIIAPLVDVLQYMAEANLNHGRINPNNIFFGDMVTLGECAIEPCGYSQPYMFEPPERAQAHPAGKGESMIAHDCYSIGVLGAYLTVGGKIFSKSQTPQEHIFRMLREGSYNAFSQLYEFSDAMTDLLRGTLNDRIHERWSWEQLQPWSRGRRYNMLPPTPTPSATRPFQIEHELFVNLKDMSHAMYVNWDHSNIIMRDGTLLRWIDLSARRKDISEILRRSISSLGGKTAKSVHQNDELIARAITILDPQAPITFKEARAHVTGIGAFLAEGFRTNQPQMVQQGVELIELGLPSIWADMYRRKDEDPPGDVTNVLWLLDRMRMIMRMPGFGFGVERVLYDLNADIPCLSPILGEHQVFTMRDLLRTLEFISKEKARDGAPFDRHIAAFIASKLNLSRESYLSEYNHLPKLARHPAFVMLRMFEQAQDSCNDLIIPGLTNWVALEVIAAFEEFHSRTLRKQLFDGIKQLATMGKFTPMSRFINQREFAAADINGFRDAIESYHKITQEIYRLKDRRYLKQKAAVSGYAVAKYIAHIALLIVAMYTLQDAVFR